MVAKSVLIGEIINSTT